MENQNLPFVNRKSVSFDRGTKFDLEVITKTDTERTIIVTGMTKEGFFRYDIELFLSEIPTSTLIGLTDIPLWISVKYASDDKGTNDVYCIIYLLIDETKSNLLCQGYLGHFMGISWPNQLPPTTLQEHGKITNLDGQAPDPGREFQFTVPDQEFWRIKSIVFTLITGIVAIVRDVSILFINPNGTRTLCFAGTVKTDSIEYKFSLFEGAQTMTGGNDIIRQTALPNEMYLPPGTLIQTFSDNMQDDDSYTRINIVYEKYYSQI